MFQHLPSLSLTLLMLLLMGTGRTVAADTTNTSWAVPIEISRNRVMVPLTINADTNRYSFLLDSGYGISMIHPSLVESLALKRVGSIDIIGIAGREEAGTYDGAAIKLGDATYTPRRLASLPSDAKRRRREDGILGSGFFRRYVVEIDAQAKVMRLHEPKSYTYSGKGEILKLEFPKDTPVIEADIVGPQGNSMRARLEIDTGCDGPMCLGSHFVKAHDLLGDAEKTKDGTRSGVGGGAKVRYGNVAQIKFGQLTLDNPKTSFFLEGSPTDETQAGHIGMPALLKFKAIFDYSRNRLILEAKP
ncbi:MAG: aspartyl protease family protein [Verrucomicrobiota bacterium]